MDRSATPFFLPCSRSSSSVSRSSALIPITREVLFSNGKSSSLDSAGIILDPMTFILAFMLPGLASCPACTIPLLALLVPSHTSSPRSSTRMLRSVLASSRAMALPVTPAPMIRTSTILFPPSSFFCPFCFMLESDASTSLISVCPCRRTLQASPPASSRRSAVHSGFADSPQNPVPRASPLPAHRHRR